MSSDTASLSAIDEWSLVLDDLIPGDGQRWPPFSGTVDTAAFVAGLGAEGSAFLTGLAAEIVALPQDARSAELKRLEHESRAAFQALLKAAYAAYYTAPSVLAVIRAVADEGPREPSPLFDPDLVAPVIAAGRAERRL
jgi:hypothetical protein